MQLLEEFIARSCLLLRRKRLLALLNEMSRLMLLEVTAELRRFPVELDAELDFDGDGVIASDRLKVYLRALDSYNSRQVELTKILIGDLSPGLLRHHSIHSISFTSSLSSLIGLSLTQFGKLLALLAEPLQSAFKHSPLTVPPPETQAEAPDSTRSGIRSTAEIRFKLFVCLYRLRHASSFRQMEALFGWASSAIQEWWRVIIPILYGYLYNYHLGFLDHMGHRWQLSQAMNWRAKRVHIEMDYDAFLERIDAQNAAGPKSRAPIVNKNKFIGSIGAVDGTYSLRCRMKDPILDLSEEGVEQDIYYTSYKKCHAYKLVLVTSHCTRKFILALAISPGSASDGAVYSQRLVSFLRQKCIPEAAFLGDHAFHSATMVISPWPTAVITAPVVSEEKQRRERFNSGHSSDRMCSEHGNRFLKMWGVVRGRSDHDMFNDESDYEKAVHVCWALHNYKRLNVDEDNNED